MCPSNVNAAVSVFWPPSVLLICTEFSTQHTRLGSRRTPGAQQPSSPPDRGLSRSGSCRRCRSHSLRCSGRARGCGAASPQLEQLASPTLGVDPNRPSSFCDGPLRRAAASGGAPSAARLRSIARAFRLSAAAARGISLRTTISTAAAVRKDTRAATEICNTSRASSPRSAIKTSASNRRIRSRLARLLAIIACALAARLGRGAAGARRTAARRTTARRGAGLAGAIVCSPPSALEQIHRFGTPLNNGHNPWNCDRRHFEPGRDQEDE